MSTWTALKRTVLGRCPSCGEAKLFQAYLKPVEHCPACGEALGRIRADDGPAWLTIIVVGHVIVPIALWVEMNTAWPVALAMTLWTTLTLAMTLALLPVAKGAFIGAIWAAQAPGSGVED